jgi:chloramphenicol 3-O-phosphotransferase
MGSQGRRGQIIFLNGASSSGKSSIARQLLLMLDPPHFHMSVDAINSMRVKQKTRELDDAALAAVLTRTRAGFHRAVAGLAEAGNDVVMDHVLSEPWRLLTAWRSWRATGSCSSACAALRPSSIGGNASAATGRQAWPWPTAFGRLRSQLL